MRLTLDHRPLRDTEEYTRVAVFLVPAANGYATGQALLIKGGVVRVL